MILCCDDGFRGCGRGKPKRSRVPMQGIVSCIAVCALLLVAVQGSAPQSRAQPKRIEVKKHGFSVERPAGWRFGIYEKDGLPVFVNLPWPKMQAQLILPVGGAIIKLISW